MNPFGFVIILIGGVLGYIGYKMVAGAAGVSLSNPLGPIKAPPAGTSASGQASAATSNALKSLVTPFGEWKLFTSLFGGGSGIGPSTVTPGGVAPASPGATETIGGRTYKPVPGNSPSGYVWQQAS